MERLALDAVNAHNACRRVARSQVASLLLITMLHSPGSAAQRAESGSIASREQTYKLRMGERSYGRFETLKKQERQRGGPAAVRHSEVVVVAVASSFLQKDWCFYCVPSRCVCDSITQLGGVHMMAASAAVCSQSGDVWQLSCWLRLPGSRP